MSPADLPDAVVEGVRHRDPDALARCYHAFADDLFRYVRARCGDDTLAEDLVEATFLELVEAAPALVGGASAVRAWLFRAARNNFLDAVRKARRRGDVPLEAAPGAERPSTEPDPAEHAVAAEHAAIIRAALRELSPDQQEVLALRFFADLSGPEVAAVTGRRVGAVKALQHRGIRALERVLAERGQLEALRAAGGRTRNAAAVPRAVQEEGTRATRPGDDTPGGSLGE